MALNVPGVVVMVFFYLMVLGTGIWASFKSKKETKKTSADQLEMTFLANRGISLAVGMFTMTDWNKTSYGSPSPLERGDGGMIFPIALNYLTPPYIGIIGIGAVAAAVMSSTDSALLSAATTFSTNIYKNILRPQASQREMKWVIWAVVVLIGIGGAAITNFQKEILVLLYIGMALTYVFMFPQLVSVLHLPGDSYEDGVHIQHFPIDTLCMLSSLICILLFSYLTAVLFDKAIIPEAWDMLHFLKLPRKLPPMRASKEDKNQRLKGKDLHQDPSKPMMDTSC
ncbi:hypothetical protein CRUP_016114 [Coryphaenoides rupestris]|nr:hypothetical protein CRUP_016114 [Coryphaenoides rupestris]